jgi:nucleoside-diphosphate-sugar epimerase
MLSRLDQYVSSDITILRFATAFGCSERMRFDLTINEFTRDLYLGKELEVFDKDTWRPYCHVNDFFNAISKVFSADSSSVHGEVFNVGGDENNYTKKMIVETILSKIPSGKVKYLDEGPDPRNYRVDFKKIRNTLDFNPSYSVDDGVDEIIEALNKGRFLPKATDSLNQYGNYDLSLFDANPELLNRSDSS